MYQELYWTGNIVEAWELLYDRNDGGNYNFSNKVFLFIL